MLPVLSMLVLLSPAADASELVLRPVTYPSNPGLTYLYVENFRELYIDPASASSMLTPSGPPAMPESASADGPAPTVPPLGSLPIVNTHNSWAEVAVEGTKIGKIGPLTVGAIHNVKSGSYTVSFTYPNGYVLDTTAATEVISEPIVPGGPGAKVALGEKVEPQPTATPPKPAPPAKKMQRVDEPESDDSKALEKKGGE